MISTKFYSSQISTFFGAYFRGSQKQFGISETAKP